MCHYTDKAGYFSIAKVSYIESCNSLDLNLKLNKEAMV